MKNVISFDHVYKRFHFQREGRSFLEMFINRWRQESKESRDRDLWVLHDVSFEVAPGETLGIIGDNGTGKSTTLKLAARIIEPTSGSVVVNGRVGALLEVGVGFHKDLTGRENIFLSGAVLGLDRDIMRHHFDEIVAFSGIDEFINMPVRHYSSGMLVRLGFSVATVLQPAVLLVDEVLAVGDQMFREKCLQRIADLKSSGTAILYVSHNLNEIREVCDRVLWIDEGKIRNEGYPDEVVSAYLNYVNQKRGLKLVSLGDLKRRGRRVLGEGVEILQSTLSNKNNIECEKFQIGDSLLIRIDYRIIDKIEKMIFGVSIYTENGIRLISMNSQVFSEGLGPGTKGSILCELEKLTLKPGKYDVTVAVSDPTSSDYKPYDHHHRAYSFEVLSEPNAPEGLVSLPHRWKRINST